MDLCFLWISLSNHSQGEGLLQVSSCVSPPEREGTVVWTLMSVMSVTQGSDMSGRKKGSVLGQSVVKLAAQLFALVNKTAFFSGRLLVRPSSLVFMGLFVKHLNFSACIMFLAFLLWPRGWTPLRFCDRCGRHRPSDQTKFWTLSRAC